MCEWDEHSAGHMWVRHGIEPHEAEEAVLDPNATTIDAGMYGNEYREALVGMTRLGRLLLVIITERGEHLRVVSARNSTRAEGKEYFRR
jgi:uncharacterized protein